MILQGGLARGGDEQLDGSSNGRQPGIVEPGEQFAQVVDAQFLESVEHVDAVLGQRHQDVAPVALILAPLGEAGLDQSIDERRERGERNVELGHEIGHAYLPGHAEHHQDAQLGHGQAGSRQLRIVGRGQQLDQFAVAGEHALDGRFT